MNNTVSLLLCRQHRTLFGVRLERYLFVISQRGLDVGVADLQPRFVLRCERLLNLVSLVRRQFDRQPDVGANLFGQRVQSRLEHALPNLLPQ
ncbi:MAG: hypothetical protein ACK56I_30585, partial [bacterium]